MCGETHKYTSRPSRHDWAEAYCLLGETKQCPSTGAVGLRRGSGFLGTPAKTAQKTTLVKMSWFTTEKVLNCK